MNKAFHGLTAGVRFSPTEGYAWDFSSQDKKEPVIPSERTYDVKKKIFNLKHSFVELQLKLKQKYEKMEKQKENAARVDSILIRLWKKHAPDVVEKIEEGMPTTNTETGGQELKRELENATEPNESKRPKMG